MQIHITNELLVPYSLAIKCWKCWRYGCAHIIVAKQYVDLDESVLLPSTKQCLNQPSTRILI